MRFSIKLAFTSLNLKKKLVQLINALGEFDVIDTDDVRRADLLIYDISENPQKGIEAIEFLLKSGDAGEVFLTADSADTAILMRAMRIGVKEFFAQPFNEVEIQEALKRFKDRVVGATARANSRNGSIISVFGSKGGVGTTTVAVNLAVSLAKSGSRPSVALLDMNILFGEIPLFLEIAPKFHWGEITKNIDRLDETFLSNILTHHRTGIHVLPSPAYLNGHVRPTPEIMAKLLGLMQRIFDFVIVDAGQSTNDTSLKVLEITNTLLLVTILSLPCLANTNKLLKSLTDMGYVPSERIKLVLNRYIKRSEISLKDAETGLGRELFCTIPNDYGASMAAINNGKPLLDIAPRSAIAKSFIDLAEALASPLPGGKEKKKSLFFGG